MDIREKILQAAARCYCSGGFRGTTTRRVASEAGVNEVTVFRHFGSKEALMREAIGRTWSELECPAPPDNPADAVKELTAWAIDFTEGIRAAAPLIRTRLGEFQEHPEIVPAEGSLPARAVAAVADYLTALRARGLTSVTFDAHAAAAMLIGALFTDAIVREGMPDMFSSTAEAGISEYVRVFLRGIGVAI